MGGGDVIRMAAMSKFYFTWPIIVLDEVVSRIAITARMLLQRDNLNTGRTQSGWRRAKINILVSVEDVRATHDHVGYQELLKVSIMRSRERGESYAKAYKWDDRDRKCRGKATAIHTENPWKVSRVLEMEVGCFENGLDLDLFLVQRTWVWHAIGVSMPEALAGALWS